MRLPYSQSLSPRFALDNQFQPNQREDLWESFFSLHKEVSIHYHIKEVTYSLGEEETQTCGEKG